MEMMDGAMFGLLCAGCGVCLAIIVGFVGMVVAVSRREGLPLDWL